MDDASAPDLAALGAALGVEARARMLLAMMDGRAWTATELARAGGVARPTASEHLDRLLGARLIAELRQGRHRYLRLASPEVAAALEALGALSAVRPAASGLRAQRADAALRRGRTCYGHLAGELGVALAEGLHVRGWVEDFTVLTARGRDGFAALGVDLPAVGGRPLLRPCLDWTERREHLAGPAADRLASTLLDRGWLRRTAGSRAVAPTDAGRTGLRELLDAGV